MRNSLIKDVIDNQKRNREIDERQTLEFNNVIVFCFKCMIVSLILLSVLYTEEFNDLIELEVLNLYMISIISFIGAIMLCRKGILILNKNFQILYPVFVFLPFFVLKINILIFNMILHIYIPSYIRILLTLLYIVIIYYILEFQYNKGLSLIEGDIE